MTWTDGDAAPEKKDETPAPAVETKPEEVASETPPEPKVETKEEPMVPQKLIGKIAKGIREKAKAELAESSERVRALEEENRRLKGEVEPPDPAQAEEDARISEKVRIEFLKRQDVYGKQKYGQDYTDAVLLVQAQNDPALVSKIQGAAEPAETLMKEAARIAEELEFGSDPVEREKKKLNTLKTSWRQEWEAEVAEKLKALKNQPTDVQNVRAAGGDVKPAIKQETWASTLPK